MRILYAHSSTSPQGGAELRLHETVVWANHDLGYDVGVVLPDHDGVYERYVSAGVPVHVHPISRLRKRMLPLGIIPYGWQVLVESRRLARLIKDVEPDLVHVNEMTDLAVIVAARLAGVPVVVHVRTILGGVIGRAYAKLLGALATKIVCVACAVRDQVFHHHGVRGDKLQVVLDPGPDYERFAPATDAERLEVRRTLGLREQCMYIGMVSKLQPVKGHLHFIQAARRVLDQFPALDIGFVVVGGDVPGEEEYKASLVREIENLGLGSKICLLNYRPDVERVLKGLDVFVHPPLYEEPFAGVVLEAMATGLPVVAYDSGGTREQFENGVSGYLVPKADVCGLAEKISALIKDKDLRERLSRAAVSHVRGSVSKAKYIDSISGLYRQVATASHSNRINGNGRRHP